jgi:hypothetical protein
MRVIAGTVAAHPDRLAAISLGASGFQSSSVPRGRPVRDAAGNSASVAAIGTAQNATITNATASQPMFITTASVLRYSRCCARPSESVRVL